jgi:hypothetical protein
VKQIRKRLTYANVMSSIAVFFILGGATAFAATKIGANEIKANSIKTGKIVKEAVTEGKIKTGAITNSKIANGAVTGEKLADNAVTTTKIADKAITGAKLNLTTIGTVPNATHATTANIAGGISEEFFAVVKADGTLTRGTPGVTSNSEGTGITRVIIGRPTVDCFTVATPGGSSPGGSNVGQISVNPSSTNLNSFWIVTANPTGVTTSIPYTLYVRC